ncbi:adenylate/guanylate cyclase domain-containing protein [Dapis sp. BLCC M126]|uniref:adenylate/guanylate cyclase domain-containing protein n=1 Tax=Dapis sp. BLCC M126 TaxID=3400189 RepID=UPI003CF9B61F
MTDFNLTYFKKHLNKGWMKSSITYKFSLASGGLLLLISGVAMASFFSMKVVRNKTESVMATSIKIQRLVFEMNNALDDARTQEREFFQQWQTIGLDTAQKKYIIPFNQKINNVRRISDELRVLLISEGVNKKWHKSHSYLIEYIEKIEKYNYQFEETLRLVINSGNNQNINNISDDFARQTEIICNKLFDLAAQEFEEASFEIKNTSKKMTLLLVLAVLATLGLGLVITNLFKFALQQLEVEQEKSEKLLLNVLPKSIAERLKDRTEIIADNFENVTVLFADIAGFTKLSASVSPTILVKLLNEIFSEFDKLAALHGLEKIKTIGDAYMVVGGLPEPNINHAVAIADMALDMQDVIQGFNQKNNSDLNMRIGLNSGQVIAGVIGSTKFIYDLWGDTVNIASRMESHGIIGEIQVTEETYLLLKDRYVLEKRGMISVKGKGEMSTYLLKSRNINNESLIQENEKVMV